MFWYVLRAHAAVAGEPPRLWRQRRAIRAGARITPAVFRHLLRGHAISARRVAALLIRPTGPDSLLVIVPALNEEGAIGGVVRSIRQHVPGVPVLVIDDCSADGTIARPGRPARRCCRCRTTWVWAAACRPATNWRTNWGSTT